MNSKYGVLNDVNANNQLSQDDYSSVYLNNGEIKILFVGNSITKHGPAPEIGWNGNWGMAASEESKDYVHLVVEELKKKYTVDYSVAQCSKWEVNYTDTDSIMHTYYQSAQDFDADIIIVRIGENMKITGDTELCKMNFYKIISFFNKNKKAKVIITSLFWKQEVLDKIIKEVSTENNYVYCDISDLEENEETMAIGEYEHKGVSVHPGDYGMKCIAERIIGCIEK